MRTRVKFCGLVDSRDVDAAVQLGADAVGFVLWHGSSRALTLTEAASLRRRLPSWVMAVGLVVNAGQTAVEQAVQSVGLDVVQFHGDETPSECAACPLPWWRAVRMRSQSDLLHCCALYQGADAYVLDAFSDGYGGSGQTFDWSWACGAIDSPRVLCGGLNPANVTAAIATVRPQWVDVSSGIQMVGQPRRKDPALMAQFMAQVLIADTQTLTAP